MVGDAADALGPLTRALHVCHFAPRLSVAGPLHRAVGSGAPCCARPSLDPWPAGREVGHDARPATRVTLRPSTAMQQCCATEVTLRLSGVLSALVHATCTMLPTHMLQHYPHCPCATAQRISCCTANAKAVTAAGRRRRVQHKVRPRLSGLDLDLSIIADMCSVRCSLDHKNSIERLILSVNAAAQVSDAEREQLCDADFSAASSLTERCLVSALHAVCNVPRRCCNKMVLLRRLAARHPSFCCPCRSTTAPINEAAGSQSRVALTPEPCQVPAAWPLTCWHVAKHKRHCLLKGGPSTSRTWTCAEAGYKHRQESRRCWTRARGCTTGWPSARPAARCTTSSGRLRQLVHRGTCIRIQRAMRPETALSTRYLLLSKHSYLCEGMTTAASIEVSNQQRKQHAPAGAVLRAGIVTSTLLENNVE